MLKPQLPDDIGGRVGYCIRHVKVIGPGPGPMEEAISYSPNVEARPNVKQARAAARKTAETNRKAASIERIPSAEGPTAQLKWLIKMECADEDRSDPPNYPPQPNASAASDNGLKVASRASEVGVLTAPYAGGASDGMQQCEDNWQHLNTILTSPPEKPIPARVMTPIKGRALPGKMPPVDAAEKTDSPLQKAAMIPTRGEARRAIGEIIEEERPFPLLRSASQSVMAASTA